MIKKNIFNDIHYSNCATYMLPLDTFLLNFALGLTLYFSSIQLQKIIAQQKILKIA